MGEKQLYLFSFQRNTEKNAGRYKVILPLDTLILLGAGVILLFTFSFSLGVERGKKITVATLQPNQANLKQRVTAEKKDSAPKKVEKVVPNTAFPDSGTEEKRKYQIQVASFFKEQTAEKEAKILKEAGYPVLINRKGKYAVVYVGEFDNKKEAKNILETLRKKYKDCILRKLCKK